MLAKMRLTAVHPTRIVEDKAVKLEEMRNRMQGAIRSYLDKLDARLDLKTRELTMLSPYHVLERGYAIVTKEGNALSSASEIGCDEAIDVIFRDGIIHARALGISDKPQH